MAAIRACLASVEEQLRRGGSGGPDASVIRALIDAIEGVLRSHRDKQWAVYLLADLAIDLRVQEAHDAAHDRWLKYIYDAAHGGYSSAQAELALRAQRGWLPPVRPSWENPERLESYEDSELEHGNHREETEWLRRGADGGNSWCRVQLGMSLLESPNPEDEQAGIEWITRAARSSTPDPQAQFLYAYAMDVGRLPAREDDERYDQYRRASESGVDEAMLALGHYLEHGIGTESNLEEALIWYERAGPRYSEGYLLAARIAMALEKKWQAGRLYELAAEDDHVEALLFMGRKLLLESFEHPNCDNVYEDFSRGTSFLERAVAEGSKEAALELAEVYDERFDDWLQTCYPAWPISKSEAIEHAICYYEQAAKLGCEWCSNRIEALRQETDLE